MELEASERVPPRDSAAWKTPLFEQYWAEKDGVPGALLFFRLGDFYELFGEDAVLAAPLLEVQLTSRNKGQKDSIPMCGVPAHAIDSYAEKLLSRGLKIALCEQVSEPGKSKLVERKVIRVLTPGLPTDFQRLNAKEPHWFYSISLQTDGPGLEICLYDFLAGRLYEGSVDSDDVLADLFSKARPQELLVAESVLQSKSLAKNWTNLSEDSAHYSKITPWIGRDAHQNLIDYLKYTQKIEDQDLDSFLPAPQGLHDVLLSGGGDYAHLPSAVIEQWNLRPELCELFDACGSAVGSRKLRELLIRPLRSVERIQARQAVLKSFQNYERFLEEARQVFDFERILGRFRIGVAQPVELFRFQKALNHSLSAMGALVMQVEWANFFKSESLPQFQSAQADLVKLEKKLQSSLIDDFDVAKAGELHLLLKTAFDAELDRLKQINETAGQWLIDFEARLKSETSIPSLKVRFNRVFGYYIEVTNAHLSKIPAHFQRKQTTVNGERFTCEELTQKEKEILSAQSQVEARARMILEDLQKEVLQLMPSIKILVEHFAWADAWAGIRKSLSKLQASGPWVYPEFQASETFGFSIVDGRHPILSARDRDFVPNSISISAAEAPILLLTGPNMAGKSTLMRQCGMAVLMAQCGMPVAAREMSLSPASGFYSRMGASDKILSGQSTFMVEMRECAQILRDANRSSFILVDEIGRGTSTRDGLAIARAILRHLHDQLGAITLFATHYHELSSDAAALKGARNASLGIREYRGRLTFLRKIEFKPAESSYGIYVAKLAGLPNPLLKSAERFFESSEDPLLPRPQLDLFQAGPVGASRQDPLMDVLDVLDLSRDSSADSPALLQDLVEEIAGMDPMDMSPKESWAKLESLVERAKALTQEKSLGSSLSPEHSLKN